MIETYNQPRWIDGDLAAEHRVRNDCGCRVYVGTRNGLLSTLAEPCRPEHIPVIRRFTELEMAQPTSTAEEVGDHLRRAALEVNGSS